MVLVSRVWRLNLLNIIRKTYVKQGNVRLAITTTCDRAHHLDLKPPRRRGRGKNHANTLRRASGRSKNRYGHTEKRLREALLHVDIRTYRTAGGCACRKSWAWRWFTSAPSRTCLIKQKCRLPHEDRWGWMNKENRRRQRWPGCESLPRPKDTRRGRRRRRRRPPRRWHRVYATNVETPPLFPHRDIGNTNSGI